MLAVLLRSGGRPDITNGILQYITDQDDGYGIDIDPCAQTPLRNRPTDQGMITMRTVEQVLFQRQHRLRLRPARP